MSGELTKEEQAAIVFQGLRDLRRQKLETELSLMVNAGTEIDAQLKDKIRRLDMGIYRLQNMFDELSSSSDPSTHKDPSHAPKQT